MIRSTEMMNDDIVVVCHLVATSPTVMWHLPSQSLWLALIHSVMCHCHIILTVMVMCDGCACRWPLVMVERWVGIVGNDGG